MNIKFKKKLCSVFLGAIVISTSAMAQEDGSTNPGETIPYGDSVARTIYSLQDNDGFVYNYLKNNSKSEIDTKAEFILIGQNINITPELVKKINEYLDDGKTIIFDGVSSDSKANKNAYSVLKTSIDADAIMFKGSIEKNTLSMTPIFSNLMLEKKVSDGSDISSNTLENILP